MTRKQAEQMADAGNRHNVTTAHPDYVEVGIPRHRYVAVQVDGGWGVARLTHWGGVAAIETAYRDWLYGA